MTSSFGNFKTNTLVIALYCCWQVVEDIFMQQMVLFDHLCTPTPTKIILIVYILLKYRQRNKCILASTNLIYIKRMVLAMNKEITLRYIKATGWFRGVSSLCSRTFGKNLVVDCSRKKTRGHSFSKYPKFSEKLTFLTPWYAHFRVLISG